jgi:putative peptidoglycan lipid II flippase
MSLVSKFLSVGSATMASRVLGFVREAMIAAVLGAGPVTDAFYAALRFPNLFRRLFAEGAFNTAFIPMFARQLEGGGEAAARRFGEDVLSVLVPLLLFLSAVAIVAMPCLVATVIAPGFTDTPEKFDLTVVMTRIMFPYLFCMSLVAMFSGILNSMRRYFLAAFAPVLLNVVLVVALVASAAAGQQPAETGVVLAWGVFLSGVLQLFFLAWGVRRTGFVMAMRRPRMTPEVRRLLVLMGPAALTGGVVQINLLVGQMIASTQDKAITFINLADRINQLPLGVIGIAIGVVLLPELARALKAGNIDDAQHLQNRSLEFSLGLSLPAAIGMMMIPGPIIALLYERGAFTAADTAMTASTLAAFAAGLPAFVLIKVFSPAFFAREDMKTPMYFSMVAVVVNIVGSLVFFPVLGQVAIALATSVSGWVNFVLLAIVLWRRDHFRPSAITLRRVAMIGVASLAMALAIQAMMTLASITLPDAGGLARALVVVTVIAVSGIVYFAIAIATGAVDGQQLKRLMRKRHTAG